MWDGCTDIGQHHMNDGVRGGQSLDALTRSSRSGNSFGLSRGFRQPASVTSGPSAQHAFGDDPSRSQSGGQGTPGGGGGAADASSMAGADVELVSATLDLHLRPAPAAVSPVNGQLRPPGVRELLLRASEAHERELGAVREELEAARREIEGLRSRVGGAGGKGDDAVTPQAVRIALDDHEPAPKTTPGADDSSRVRRGAVAAAADGPRAQRQHHELKLSTSSAGFKDHLQIHIAAAVDSRVASRDSGPSGDEPVHFKAKAAWNQDIQIVTNLKKGQFMTAGSRHALPASSDEDDPGAPLRASRGDGDFPSDVRCVISPEASWRLTWDLAGLILICYDLLIIPFVQCYSDDPGLAYAAEHGLLSYMDWVTLMFWTGDMLQGFFLGYWKDGRPVTKHSTILKNYMKSWFVVDVLVVGPEWMLIFARSFFAGSGAGGIGLLGKILKSARAIRVLRLVRLVKLQRIVNKCYDMITDEKTFIAVNLLKLLLAILALNHVIACCWYGLGRIGRGDLPWVRPLPDNWIDASMVGSANLSYKYTTSLHWSLTQFTPASMQVSATNVAERVFSIVVLFFAMVCFSSIVGSITGSMTQLRSLKNDDAKQFWLLRRFFKQKGVEQNLQRGIIKFLEHQVCLKGNQVQVSQLKLLHFLSQELQRELEHSLHHVHWQGHPFFNLLDQKTNVILHLIDHNKAGKRCLNLRFCSEEEKVFDAGEEAKFMYFVCWRNKPRKLAADVDLDELESGDELPADFYFEYTPAAYANDRLARSPRGGPRRRQILGSGDWIGEAVLWAADWRHVGRLMCCYVCEIMTVDPETFVKVVRCHPRPWFLARTYAHMFVKWINDEDEDHPLPRQLVTDVRPSGTESSARSTPWYKAVKEELDRQLKEAEQGAGVADAAHGSQGSPKPASACDALKLLDAAGSPAGACAEAPAAALPQQPAVSTAGAAGGAAAQPRADSARHGGPFVNAAAPAAPAAAPSASPRRRLLGTLCCSLVGVRPTGDGL